jgi:hypothetical protein
MKTPPSADISVVLALGQELIVQQLNSKIEKARTLLRAFLTTTLEFLVEPLLSTEDSLTDSPGSSCHQMWGQGCLKVKWPLLVRLAKICQAISKLWQAV